MQPLNPLRLSLKCLQSVIQVQQSQWIHFIHKKSALGRFGFWFWVVWGNSMDRVSRLKWVKQTFAFSFICLSDFQHSWECFLYFPECSIWSGSTLFNTHLAVSYAIIIINKISYKVRVNQTRCELTWSGTSWPDNWYELTKNRYVD